jgi:hypothetical protein
MKDSIKIARFYHGPPDSGHGGYTSGLIAQLIGGDTVEVTLRSPPPLDRSLNVERDPKGLRVMDRETVIAEAESSETDVTKDVPPVVTYHDAVLAQIDYLGFKSHPFPTCLVCGPGREPHEGLRIFAGRVRGTEVVASAWVPEAHVAHSSGRVRPEFVWAALDCPGGWALPGGTPMGNAVLGRITARVLKPVSAGKRYAVVGWPLGAQGRKLQSGSAVFDDKGELHAAARATWIVPAS